ncbi:MAG: hypothetical protein JWP89_6476 [Schlesneria sp.]|nr:hypothetical protein [Schlesneria sp.]
MRLFLAALTVGAAGIAYAYTQQTPAPAAESQTKVGRPLFDWQSADDTLKAASTDLAPNHEEPPLVVRDTISQARTEVTSVLDEFVRGSGASNDVPAPADVVSQAAAESPTADSELIPFASSDSPTGNDASDIAPADAIATINQPQADLVQTKEAAPLPDSAPAAKPQSPASQDTETGPALGKPTISEATIVKKQPTSPPPNGANREPAVSVKQPSSAGSRSKTELLPSSKQAPKPPLVDAEWKLIGRSGAGMPLHSRRFGRQGTRTLIIAGLDGLDVVGTRWNDELAEALLRRSDLLQNNEIMIVRAGNPEGLTNRIPTNLRGVSINRNFPSRRYQALPDKSTGTGPASEAETKAILDVLYSFRPRRVIHLASTSGRSTVLYNRAATDVGDELEKQYKLHVQLLDPEQVPGSIEEFADGTLDAAVISLKLNSGPEWQGAWKKNAAAVLTAINGQSQEKLVAASTEKAALMLEPTSSVIPNMDEDVAPQVKKRRGYEELPPPPR